MEEWRKWLKLQEEQEEREKLSDIPAITVFLVVGLESRRRRS